MNDQQLTLASYTGTIDQLYDKPFLRKIYKFDLSIKLEKIQAQDIQSLRPFVRYTSWMLHNENWLLLACYKFARNVEENEQPVRDWSKHEIWIRMCRKMTIKYEGDMKMLRGRTKGVWVYYVRERLWAIKIRVYMPVSVSNIDIRFILYKLRMQWIGRLHSHAQSVVCAST